MVATHEIIAYLDLKDSVLSPLSQSPTIPVRIHSPLADALNQLTSPPLVVLSGLSFGYHLGNIPIQIRGEEAGTLGNPNVGMFLEASRPSSFGRGEQAVMDLDYRNGRQIEGKDIDISWFNHSITFCLCDTLFSGKFGWRITTDLYKVAIYEAGGKFHWHRDSTHGDGHHATVLVALPTEWKGGNLLLRHRGEQVSVDLHPAATPGRGTSLVAAAFYTDIEHMVEEVTDGVRIVLQYDVLLENMSASLNEDSEYSLRPQPTSEGVSFPFSNPLSDNSVTLDVITSLLANMLAQDEPAEVGFALAHLYRSASIRPEYLKGIDALVYNHLKTRFDVTLSPMFFSQDSDGSGSWKQQSLFAKKFPSVSNSGSSDLTQPTSTEFHLPKDYESRKISETEYIEHVGNEPQIGSCSYFGGGMFVRRNSS